MPLNVVRNDITRMRVDAIVNAANTQLLEGGGVCGAIFGAAGADELQDACDKLAPIKTGEAVITPGFALPAKHIIHAAGPVYIDGAHGEEALLRACYTNSLGIAAENGCESIAFPLISSGIYGYPKDEALAVATNAIGSWLADSENDMDVFLVVFDKAAFKISTELLGDIKTYIDEHLADELEYRSGRSELLQVERDALEAPQYLVGRGAPETPQSQVERGALEAPQLQVERGAFETSQLQKVNEAAAGFASKRKPPKKKPGAREGRARRPDAKAIGPPGGNEQRKATILPAMRDSAANWVAGAALLPGAPVGKAMQSDAPLSGAPGGKAMQPDAPLSVTPVGRAMQPAALYSASLQDEIDRLDEPFSSALLRLIDAKGETDAAVYKRANIDRKLFSKIRNPDYRPSKKTALALAVALRLDLDETGALLRYAGFALSSSQKFDVIIQYFITRGKYDIYEINNVLFEYDQPLLG